MDDIIETELQLPKRGRKSKAVVKPEVEAVNEPQVVEKSEMLVKVCAKDIGRDDGVAGFYGHRAMRVGEEFEIKENQFSATWMKRV